MGRDQQFVDWLFLDMNAYFASVEQEMRPELRGKPTAVVPVDADTTCCIAASYEAKKYGVKTGTKVGLAKQLCPDINIVEARPVRYVQYHHSIIEAVNSVIPVDTILSIDEMCCRLTGSQRNLQKALSLAKDVKRVINEKAGESLKCSVGLSTNRFLAKVAAEMKKPNGLTVIRRDEIQEKLCTLELQDLPGIGEGMYARFKRRGVHSIEQMFKLKEEDFANIWQSIVGRRWWHMIRGEDLAEPETSRKTVGHSHVLPPHMRTEEKTRAVIVRLIHKAAFRLRRLGYVASQMDVKVRYFDDDLRWKKTVKMTKRSDTQSLLEAFSSIWPDRPRDKTPLSVSMTLYDLTPAEGTSLSLFPREIKRDKVAAAVDSINERYGSNSIYYAPMHSATESAPMRISFTSIPDILAEGNKLGQ